MPLIIFPLLNLIFTLELNGEIVNLAADQAQDPGIDARVIAKKARGLEQLYNAFLESKSAVSRTDAKHRLNSV
jgi:hypothetical protein